MKNPLLYVATEGVMYVIVEVKYVTIRQKVVAAQRFFTLPSYATRSGRRRPLP